MNKKLIAAAVAVALPLTLYSVFSGANKPYQNGIYQPAKEQTYIADIISSAVAMVTHSQAATKPSPYRRDVHAKAHGCVQATFSVPELADDRLKHGVFSQSHDYKAWIRFSSGDTMPQPDSVHDARGMAIKVMGVDGKKLIKSEENAKTQDFVMINNDVFFIPTVEEYAQFMQYQAQGSKFGYFFNDFNWNVFTWHFRDLYLGAKTLKKAPNSLLKEQYHSLSAYRLGPDHFMKYSAKACDNNIVMPVDRGLPNFLRTELEENLAGNKACFDFLVQLQNPNKNMPIEDTTVRWETKDSPFIKVARVTIEPQAFNSEVQNQFCENLSFTPWHATKEIEPVGGINRLRKAVYNEISRFRHGKNGALRKEPTSWCLEENQELCTAD
ncbi:catalase family protein [Thalassotalea atypica]|uniref:catalase family protein n=1 Tax=Thalassotalea atypica TaxID=2054316 RepID=UPI00257348F2|nr:catalase family protein [Thalassotalea atypica]